MNTNDIKIGDTVYFTGTPTDYLTNDEPLSVLSEAFEFNDTGIVTHLCKQWGSRRFGDTVYVAATHLTKTPPAPQVKIGEPRSVEAVDEALQLEAYKKNEPPKGCSLKDVFNF